MVGHRCIQRGYCATRVRNSNGAGSAVLESWRQTQGIKQPAALGGGSGRGHFDRRPLTNEPAVATPVVDADIVRTVVRERGYIHDQKLGWLRLVSGSDTVTVTAVIERLGGNPRHRYLREAVGKALRTLHDNPPE
jgi:hypothetical protein